MCLCCLEENKDYLLTYLPFFPQPPRQCLILPVIPWLNIKLDLQSLLYLGSMCTAVPIGWDPSPRIWAFIRGRYWSAKITPCCHLCISLLLTNTVSPVRACVSIWLERFRGTQKEDDRGPLSINSSLDWRLHFVNREKRLVARWKMTLFRWGGRCCIECGIDSATAVDRAVGEMLHWLRWRGNVALGGSGDGLSCCTVGVWRGGGGGGFRCTGSGLWYGRMSQQFCNVYFAQNCAFQWRVIWPFAGSRQPSRILQERSWNRDIGLQ